MKQIIFAISKMKFMYAAGHRHFKLLEISPKPLFQLRWTLDYLVERCTLSSLQFSTKEPHSWKLYCGLKNKKSITEIHIQSWFGNGMHYKLLSPTCNHCWCTYKLYVVSNISQWDLNEVEISLAIALKYYLFVAIKKMLELWLFVHS